MSYNHPPLTDLKRHISINSQKVKISYNNKLEKKPESIVWVNATKPVFIAKGIGQVL